jgi:hypothetical protein
MADFTKQHVQNLIAQLKLLNVKEFRINFDGGGDDGQIDEIEFYNTNNETFDIPSDMISWVYHDFNGQEAKDAKVTLHKAIEDLGYQMLDETGHDWVNNDGGYGTIDVLLEGEDGKPSVHMEINIRYTNEDQYDYDDNNFSMFAEGEHLKTEQRQLRDKMMAEWAEQRANRENA